MSSKLWERQESNGKFGIFDHDELAKSVDKWLRQRRTAQNGKIGAQKAKTSLLPYSVSVVVTTTDDWLLRLVPHSYWGKVILFRSALNDAKWRKTEVGALPPSAPRGLSWHDLFRPVLSGQIKRADNRLGVFCFHRVIGPVLRLWSDRSNLTAICTSPLSKGIALTIPPSCASNFTAVHYRARCTEKLMDSRDQRPKLPLSNF